MRRGRAVQPPPRASLAERLRALRESFWALLLPGLVVVGLKMGVFTPTEAGVVAAVYALLVATLVYRELAWRRLTKVFIDAARTTAVIMFLVAAAIRLVRACPETVFVLDHLGKPDVAGGRTEPWRTELRQLAELENVYCKLSGLATEAAPAGWTTAQVRPYLEHAVACFGWDRILFGGDWPVCTLATDFPRWVAAVGEVLGGCSADERARFRARNAERVYRI